MSRRSCIGSTLVVVFFSCLFGARAGAGETVLFNFAGVDGTHPYGRLILDSAGNLYGTTYDGGLYGAGTIFELVYSGTGSSYSETVLYNFTGGSDGGFPMAGVIMDSAGNLYGTTTCGGSSTCTGGTGGNGVVFELSPLGYSVLHKFTGGSDGGLPAASLTFDAALNLYGTTEAGGVGSCMSRVGCGVVFELLQAGGYHTESVLHRFTGGGDGGVPMAPVIFNAAGTTLYGTTYSGGGCTVIATGCGVVFQLTPPHDLKILHRFRGMSDGSLPTAPVVFNGAGTLLYGTATAGGNTICPGGCGVAFRLQGTTLTTIHVMHSFAGADGADPTGGLAFDTTSLYLYGTTFAGGESGLGVVFELQQSGAYTLLHSFTGAPDDGANPFAGLVLVLGEENSDVPPPPPAKGKGGCPPSCGTAVKGGSNNGGAAFGAGGG